jgi:hypothetical protein
MDLANLVTVPWVVPVVCGSTVAIVAIVGGVINDCFKCIAQTNLKRAMVENNYTAEQIVQVMNVRGAKPFTSKQPTTSPAKGYA